MPWKFKVPAGPGGMRLPGLGGSSSGGSSSGGFGGSGIPGIPSPSSGSPSGSGVPGWGDWLKSTAQGIGGMAAGHYANKLLTGGAKKQAQIAAYPMPPSGYGARMNQMMANMFPGTNPWERLGVSNPGGSGSAGVQQASQARQVGHQVNMQYKTATDVAKIQAGAQVESARVSSMPGHRQAAVSEALVSENIDKIQAEVRNLDAGTRNQLQQAVRAIFEGRLAHVKTQLESINVSRQADVLDSMIYKSLHSGLVGGTRTIVSDSGEWDWDAIWTLVLGVSAIHPVGGAVLKAGTWIGDKFGKLKPWMAKEFKKWLKKHPELGYRVLSDGSVVKVKQKGKVINPKTNKPFNKTGGELEKARVPRGIREQIGGP